MTVIAITGASGFVGRHLCPTLASRGYEIVEIGRPMLLSERLAPALRGVDVLIHLVARAHVMRETSTAPEALYRAVNVDLTKRAARAAATAGVKRFVFLSSAGVLGQASPAAGFADDSVPCPHDLYTATKLEAEQWLRSEQSPNIETVIVRPPLIYGPGASGNFQRLLQMALKGVPLPIARLAAPRTMISLRNVTDLIALVATDVRAVGFTMLAADREMMSIADLFLELARYAGRRPWLAPLPEWCIKKMLWAAGRSVDIKRLTDPFVLCPSVARERLGWTPPFSLSDELRWTVQSEIAGRTS